MSRANVPGLLDSPAARWQHRVVHRLWEQRARIGLGAVFLLWCAFYLWSAATSGTPFNFGNAQQDPYNELANAFLRGRLALSIPVPPALAHAADPYDPRQFNAATAVVHDLAYFHGHFYLTWGPAPVLTLFLPWRLLQLGALPPGFAIFLFGSVALGFSLALLASLCRHLPATRPWQLVAAGSALGAGNVVAFCCRSPQPYEVSIACSLCFAMAGCYLLWTGVWTRRGARMALASACLGIAVAGRQDDLLLGALLLVGWWSITRAQPLELPGGRRQGDRRGSWRRLRRPAAQLLGPFLGIVALLGWYNAARFGVPWQFGEAYQLTGIPQADAVFYRFAYIGPSLFGYLVDPIRLSLGFPFFFLPSAFRPAGSPASYAPKVMGGIFTSAPMLIFVLALVLRSVRRRLGRELGLACSAMALSALALVLVIAWAIPGGSTRYEADFASLALVPALIVWIALGSGGRRWRPLIAGVGALASTIGVLAGLGLSINGYYPEDAASHPNLALSDPDAEQRLAALTGLVPTLADELLGHPVIAAVNDPEGVSAPLGLVNAGVGRHAFFYLSEAPTTLEILAPATRRYRFAAGFGPGPGLRQGTSVHLELIEGGRRRAIRYHAGVITIPLALHTGVNEVALAAISKQPASNEVIPYIQVYQPTVTR